MTTRVLVVDDSPTVRRIVSLSFAGEDAKVEGTANPAEAIGLVRSWNPDVVLAATHLPGCSGYEICRTIKADPELSRIPVVLLTGALDGPEDEEAAAAGCDGRLSKPLDSLELVRLVQGLVRPAARPQDRREKGTGPSAGRHFASSRTLDSFLGDGRVLDLIDPAVLKRSAQKPPRPVTQPEVTAPPSEPVPAEPTPPPPTTAASAGDCRDPLDAAIEEKIRSLAPAILHELAERIVGETLKRRMDELSKEPRG
jgi:CheY-like chemotaxis protein